MINAIKPAKAMNKALKLSLEVPSKAGSIIPPANTFEAKWKIMTINALPPLRLYSQEMMI